MISKEDAMLESHFHFGTCYKTIGIRGGETLKVVKVRRNGKTQTWKRDADRFRIPIKHGLYSYGEITQDNAGSFHCEKDCNPLEKKA